MPKINEDECLIRVKSTGICNSDIFRAFENGAYHYPLIMGHEFKREIVECGSEAHNISAGQRVVEYLALIVKLVKESNGFIANHIIITVQDVMVHMPSFWQSESEIYLKYQKRSA